MTLSIRTALLLAAIACLLPASALAAGKPAATTGGSSGVSPTAATIKGSVNPNGLVTTWYFQYGKTKSYGTRTTAQDAGSGGKRLPVSSTLTGLTGKTTYHYRLVALNSAGTTAGADRTFRTPEAPTTSSIAVSPNPAVFNSVLVVTGFLTGPRGGGGKQVALEANAFPFTAGFTQVGNTVVTGADGGYQFVTGAFITAQMHVVDRSDPTIVSPIFTSTVALKTTLKVSRRVSARRTVRFTGFVTPRGNSSAVLIQKRTHRGGWKNVKVLLPHSKKTAKSDRFSRRFRAKSGVYRAIARPNGSAYAEGRSFGKRVRHR